MGHEPIAFSRESKVGARLDVAVARKAQRVRRRSPVAYAISNRATRVARRDGMLYIANIVSVQFAPRRVVPYATIQRLAGESADGNAIERIVIRQKGIEVETSDRYRWMLCDQRGPASVDVVSEKSSRTLPRNI